MNISQKIVKYYDHEIHLVYEQISIDNEQYETYISIKDIETIVANELNDPDLSLYTKNNGKCVIFSDNAEVLTSVIALTDLVGIYDKYSLSCHSEFLKFITSIDMAKKFIDDNAKEQYQYIKLFIINSVKDYVRDTDFIESLIERFHPINEANIIETLRYMQDCFKEDLQNMLDCIKQKEQWNLWWL